jgi:hypothetical protein
VGGHNLLIHDGRSLGPSFDGDAVLFGSYRRTAIGMSRDRRTLYLLTTGKLLTGVGLVAELQALAAQAGAPPIDVAANMDGGGSSQMYVQGQGQIVSTGRQVNNHVGLFASGQGGSWNCNNIPPRGTLDEASCDVVAGWAQDWNVKDSPIRVFLSFGGPVFSGVPAWFEVAGRFRADLCGPLESCEHAFEVPTPLGLLDGQPHAIYGYAMDSEGGQNTELTHSPRTLQCAKPPPPGVLRHVTSEGWLAWRFDAFRDVQPVNDEVLDARGARERWPAAPSLVRATGAPEVYVLDGLFRRHVTATAAVNWRLDLSTVREVSRADLEAWAVGPPLRERPWGVKGTGPAIFLVDDELPAVGLPPEAPPAPSPRPAVAGAPSDDAPRDDGATRSPEPVVAGCATAAGSPGLWWLALVAFRRHPARRR